MTTQTAGWNHTRGTGRINAIEAWKWGLKAFGQNPGAWLLMVLVINVVSSIPFAFLFLSPILYGYALKSTRERKWQFDGPAVPNYGRGVVTMLLSFLIAFAAFAAVLLLAYAISGDNANGFTIVTPLLVLGIILVPLLAFPVFYALDGTASGVGDALKKGFAAGARNYPAMILFGILAILANAIGFALMMVGLIPATAILILATAHAYRQASGGEVPEA